jgi:hypothetical protein
MYRPTLVALLALLTLALEPVDNAWKVARMQLLDEQRVQFERV